jgi:hypothetical protein
MVHCRVTRLVCNLLLPVRLFAICYSRNHFACDLRVSKPFANMLLCEAGFAAGRVTQRTTGKKKKRKKNEIGCEHHCRFPILLVGDNRVHVHTTNQRNESF